MNVSLNMLGRSCIANEVIAGINYIKFVINIYQHGEPISITCCNVICYSRFLLCGYLFQLPLDFLRFKLYTFIQRNVLIHTTNCNNMEYRLDKNRLLDILSAWDGYLNKRVHLVACAGTALTLMDIKESTKDIDLLIPVEDEYKYLVGILRDLGYERKTGAGWSRDDGFIFDLYAGKAIFTTELLESPLIRGNNIPLKEFAHIYLGILNYYDLLISKIFRGTTVDMDDCLALFKVKQKEIDMGRLKNKFYETSSYDVSDQKNKRNFQNFLGVLEKEGFKI